MFITLRTKVECPGTLAISPVYLSLRDKSVNFGQEVVIYYLN